MRTAAAFVCVVAAPIVGGSIYAGSRHTAAAVLVFAGLMAAAAALDWLLTGVTVAAAVASVAGFTALAGGSTPAQESAPGPLTQGAEATLVVPLSPSGTATGVARNGGIVSAPERTSL